MKCIALEHYNVARRIDDLLTIMSRITCRVLPNMQTCLTAMPVAPWGCMQAHW